MVTNQCGCDPETNGGNPLQNSKFLPSFGMNTNGRRGVDWLWIVHCLGLGAVYKINTESALKCVEGRKGGTVCPKSRGSWATPGPAFFRSQTAQGSCMCMAQGYQHVCWVAMCFRVLIGSWAVQNMSSGFVQKMSNIDTCENLWTSFPVFLISCKLLFLGFTDKIFCQP